MATNYSACPKCGKPDPKKVSFTWWGGILGPKLLTHVKCEACGTTFNGKSGKDNTTGIVIYCLVVALFLFALVGLIAAAVVFLVLRS